MKLVSSEFKIMYYSIRQLKDIGLCHGLEEKLKYKISVMVCPCYKNLVVFIFEVFKMKANILC